MLSLDSDIYLAFFPSETQRRILCHKIYHSNEGSYRSEDMDLIIETGGTNVVFDQILQLALLQTSCFAQPDIFVVRYPLFLAFLKLTVEEKSVTLHLLDQTFFKRATILFRQSPFNAREVLILTEGSLFFRIILPTELKEELRFEARLEISLDVERQQNVLK